MTHVKPTGYLELSEEEFIDLVEIFELINDKYLYTSNFIPISRRWGEWPVEKEVLSEMEKLLYRFEKDDSRAHLILKLLDFRKQVGLTIE